MPVTVSVFVMVGEPAQVTLSEHVRFVVAPAARLNGAGRQEAGSDKELRVTLDKATCPVLLTEIV